MLALTYLHAHTMLISLVALLWNSDPITIKLGNPKRGMV